MVDTILKLLQTRTLLSFTLKGRMMNLGCRTNGVQRKKHWRSRQNSSTNFKK